MKFLLFCYSAAGHVNPMQAVAKELVQRGHEVVWMTGYDSEKKVVATGARFVRLDALEALDEAIRTENRPAPPARQLVLQLLDGRTVAQVEDVRRVLKTFQPDCLLNELNLTGSHCLYELGHIPTYASLGVLPLWHAHPDLPPPFTGLPPGRTWYRRLLNQLYNLYHAFVLFPLFVYPPIQAQRKQLGLPPMPWSTIIEAIARSPFLHIQLSCPSLEYFHDDSIYPQVHFTGPLIPPDASGGAFTNPPSWWPQVQSHPCVIFISQGTYTMNPDLLIVPALRALASDQQLLLVVTSPHEAQIRRQLPDLPANVHIAPFLPYDMLFPHVHLFITNGGYGGVKQALLHGIPVITSGLTEDKMDVGARVAWTMAGIDLKSDNPTEQQIGDAVRVVLSNARYKKNAKRLGDEMKRCGGVEKACDLLEELVRKKGLVARHDKEKLPEFRIL